MKLIPMRYAGYTWHHNPKSLKVSNSKKVVDLSLPYSFDVLQSFGESLVTITGVGELYGKDCISQFERLSEVYEKGEEGILCLPDIAPMYACFDSLVMELSSTPNVVRYSFSFKQIAKKKEKFVPATYIYSKQGESLFLYSYIYNVDIKTLVEINPHIMFINSLSQGERVNLC